MLKILRCCLFLVLWVPPLPLVSLAAESAEKGLNVQINFENDAFYDKDYYYTNGLQIRFISPELHEFTIGQHIYTPEDKKSKERQEHDRPYAGYLYAAFAKHWLQDGHLSTLELAAGVIGPSALGEVVQNDVHGAIGVKEAKGWKHQLEDEPALMLTVARTWRLNPASRGLSWDILPRMALSLGNPFTQASASAQARFGWNLPNDFGSSYMRPGSGVFLPDAEPKLSLYLFAGVEGRALAWNSFLDGNVWRDSHSVDKKHFITELSAGLIAAYKDWRVGYTHIYRSKEFDGQKRGQNYGSVMCGYVF